MVNFIAGTIVASIIGAIIYYLVRAKRRGEKCIGCPYAKMCGGKCGNTKSEDNAASKKEE